LIQLVGDRFDVPTSFYHACSSGPTGFFIIFGGGSRKQIITRYLTNNPRLEAGIELKKITTTLCETNERDFTSALNVWYVTWSSFLKERITDPITGRWHYTHKRLRSAYRSLRLNLPYLFTYQKYPDLNIPNTTNSLDGCFAYLKELVRVHRGSRRELKIKIIKEILRE